MPFGGGGGVPFGGSGGVPTGGSGGAPGGGSGGTTGGSGGTTGGSGGSTGGNGGSTGGSGGTTGGGGGTTGGSGGTTPGGLVILDCHDGSPGGDEGPVTTDLIDDLEDQTEQILPTNGRDGYWYAYHDDSGGTMVTRSSILTSRRWSSMLGAGMATRLMHKSNATAREPRFNMLIVRDSIS